MRALILAVSALVGSTTMAYADTCALDAAPTVAFGGYDVYAAAPTDAAGTITLRCLVSLSVTVDLSAGNSSSYATRQLKPALPATTPLAYNLYLDAARTQIWGNGTNGTAHLGPALVVLSVWSIPIYGRIPAKQDVAAGSYTDTITVTLNY